MPQPQPNEKLLEKLKTLPRSPGVYFHKSASGEIIYVGKAAVLKNRVRQYFQKSREVDLKTQALVAEIDDTDWVETDSELDALFLESEMVKRYMPRYNVLLRDDRSQMFVRIDMKSEWPTISFTRLPADDNAEYFGPYYNGYAIKKAIRYLRRIFPHYTKPAKREGRPDLDAHMGLSPSSDTTSAEYKASLRQLISYIKGGRKAIIKDIEKLMNLAAANQNFEEAALQRNRLQDLKSLQQRILFGDKEFLDISKDKALDGLATLLGLPKVPARIEGFDISHTGGKDVVASMVVFTNGVSDRSNYRKFKISKDRNDDYVAMREVIYRRFSEKNIKSWGIPDLVLIDGGKGQLESAVAAMTERGVAVPVVGLAKREEEIVISVAGSNIKLDFLSSLYNGDQKDDSVFVDKGNEYYIVNLHAHQRNASGHSKNLRASSVNVFHTYSHVTKLIQRIRDESHRFAISYHSVLRSNRQKSNLLEDIPGVGPATRRKIIKHFGSVKAASEASIDELSVVVGGAKATVIAAHIQKTNS